MLSKAITIFLGLTVSASAYPLYSPLPWHEGGLIDPIRQEMFEKFPPGSCLEGTFISAATQVLAVPKIRVRPDSQFWFHHASPVPRPFERQSPWAIMPQWTEYALRGLPKPVADHVRTNLPETTEFVVLYGHDLIRMGVRGC